VNIFIRDRTFWRPSNILFTFTEHFNLAKLENNKITRRKKPHLFFLRNEITEDKPVIDVNKFVADGAPKAGSSLHDAVEVHPVRPRPKAVVSVRLEHLVQVFIAVHVWKESVDGTQYPVV
jgi:hypothetical protein